MHARESAGLQIPDAAWLDRLKVRLAGEYESISHASLKPALDREGMDIWCDGGAEHLHHAKHLLLRVVHVRRGFVPKNTGSCGRSEVLKGLLFGLHLAAQLA